MHFSPIPVAEGYRTPPVAGFSWANHPWHGYRFQTPHVHLALYRLPQAAGGSLRPLGVEIAVVMGEQGGRNSPIWLRR